MPESLFTPIRLSYRGRVADDHLVDGQELGKSIAGASRAANAACHFWLFGQITHDSRAYRVKYFAGPSRKNGLEQDIVAIMMAGNLPTFAPILLKVGEFVIGRIIEAVVKKLIGQTSGGTDAISSIVALAQQHQEFASQVHQGHMRDKAWLQELVTRMMHEMMPAYKALPEPVGRSVREMVVGDRSKPLVVIDEPIADAMRSGGEVEVGKATEYEVTVDGVTRSTGACRLVLDDGSIVAGKITDPALEAPGDAYTEALNTGQRIRVTAKPTLKGGEIHRLYVSDVRPMPRVRRRTAGRRKARA